jgi:hypothetical protein
MGDMDDMGVTSGIHWQDDVAFASRQCFSQPISWASCQSVGHYTISLLMLTVLKGRP